ncbi:MAG: histone deacetylase family protein [Pseudomonadota bacterium]
MPVALLSHPAFERHEVPPNHPECPQRLTAIADALYAAGVYDLLTHVEARPATRAELALVHTEPYLQALFELRPAAGFVRIDPDTFVGPHTLAAAVHAAGAAIQASELVLNGDAEAAFCCVRPPGHHAGRDYAMGFCYLNNIAVAAAHALTKRTIERVAVLDFDVHHGNGTEDIFADDPRVLLCSVYQHPFYPHTGAADRPERIVNAPLPAGSDGAAVLGAIDTLWGPAIDRFAPQAIFVSAGFDGHAGDPLAEFRLTDADYTAVTEWIVARAAEHAAGRIVSCLEGGYSLDHLGGSVTAHLRALAGI